MNKQVIYIIGSGRSGTTLLDIILGNAAGVFSAGELNRFTERNGTPTDTNNIELMNFWEKVCTGLSKQINEPPIHYAGLSKKFEHHFSFYYLFIPPNKKQFSIYANFQQKFFDALQTNVQTQFQKNIIIDSSKYALRGYFLSMILGKQISFINIKRNPLAVVESFQKKDVEQEPKSRLKANLYLLAVNCLSLWVFKKLKNKHALSSIYYEDLLKDPLSTLSGIENDLGISLQKAKDIISENHQLKVGYLFDGNRLRVEKMISLKRTNATYKPSNFIDSIFYSLHKITWYKK
ncbi:MAG: sulfotransferase [Bacteroidetes bacterium]|nr:sulfotransferase [Bacteroidota bacterium]